MVLVQRDELVQACAAQAPAEPLAKREFPSAPRHGKNRREVAMTQRVEASAWRGLPFRC